MRSSLPRFVGWLAAALMAGVALTLASRSNTSAPAAPVPATQVSPAETPTPPAPAPAPAPEVADEIELSLSADTAIESVRAPGLRRVTLDGKKARLFVGPFSSTLSIEATLAGGKTAKATATASGPRELALSSGGAASTPGKARRELQDNPYGAP